jgi:hypothetical protein
MACTTPPVGDLELFIKTLNGQIMVVAKTSDSINSVKAKIEAKMVEAGIEIIPANQQQLTYGGASMVLGILSDFSTNFKGFIYCSSADEKKVELEGIRSAMSSRGDVKTMANDLSPHKTVLTFDRSSFM